MAKISRCPETVWRRLALADASCTFFQTPEWHQITADYLGAESHPFLFEWHAVQAVLPMLKVEKFIFDYFFSPLGTYTSFISAGTLARAQIAEIRKFLLSKNIELFSSPYAKISPSLPGFQENSTYIVRLDGLDPGDISKTWKKGHREDLRMGLRKGVTVRKAGTPDDLKAYYQLYRNTYERWRDKLSVIYEYSLFERIWNLLVPEKKAALWLAEWQGKMVSGCLVFYHNKHAAAWHAASDYRYFELYANQVIHFNIISDAIKKGLRVYDFNPSHGLEGVIKFKEGFGAEKLEFRSYWNHTPLYRIAAGIKKCFCK